MCSFSHNDPIDKSQLSGNKSFKKIVYNFFLGIDPKCLEKCKKIFIFFSLSLDVRHMSIIGVFLN